MRRVLKWGIRVVVVVVVLGIVAWAVANYWAAKALHNQVTKLREAGQPLTFDDLDAMAPKVDEGQDAGPYYSAALALVHDVERPGPVGYDAAMEDGGISNATLAEVRKRVEENRLALEMLDRGAGLSGCEYDIGIRYGMSLCLKRLNPVGQLANAASLRTRLVAFERQGDKSVESAISSLRMLRIFDREPILVAMLVKIGRLARLCNSDVPVIVEQGLPSGPALHALDEALEQVEKSMDMRRMLMAERVYVLEITRNIRDAEHELKADKVVAPALPEQWRASGIGALSFRIMVAKTLPIHDRFIEAAGKGWPAIMEATRDIAAAPPSKWSPFEPILVPSFARSVVTTGRCLAIVRSTRVALQVEQYRLANGRLPETLEHLPVARLLPVDPFTGQSLVYHKTANGYCVYSLGEDRRDDGGKEINVHGPNWGIQVRVPATSATIPVAK